MSTIILVHGAWLDASCWNAVASSLRELGHTVIAPNLPGHGTDGTALAGRTLEAYAARVLHDVDAATEPVVLVGHSMGGVVISTVAERRPERIRRLVYVAAYLLGEGESIKEIDNPGSLVAAALEFAPDWSTASIPAARMPEIFFHDAPPSASDAVRALVAASAPEATAPLNAALHVTEARWGRVPRSYVTTRQDRGVTPALQDRMLAARPCEPVIAIETGHAPFIAQPDILAAHLARLASSSEASSPMRHDRSL